jgi:hypothetical protein
MVMLALRMWGQVYGFPPIAASNQPAKERSLPFWGSLGRVTSVPGFSVIVATFEPPLLLKMIV